MCVSHGTSQFRLTGFKVLENRTELVQPALHIQPLTCKLSFWKGKEANRY